MITLMYRTVLEPNDPIVIPDPVLIHDGPYHGPCSCSNSDGGAVR